MGVGLSHRREMGGQRDAAGRAAPSLLEVLVILLVLVGAAYGFLQWRPWDRWGKQIYLVPIGRAPAGSVERLVGYCRDKFKLTVQTLPGISLGPDAFDFRRRQLVAEELIALMKREHPAQANNPRAILVGITGSDMYARGKPESPFVLASGDSARFAVISSARMDPANLGRGADEELLDSRLRKMVFRQIGSMYFKLPPSPRARSVMHGPVRDVGELDVIGEDF
jgi:predicted Zn-dependent protease